MPDLERTTKKVQLVSCCPDFLGLQAQKIESREEKVEQ